MFYIGQVMQKPIDITDAKCTASSYYIQSSYPCTKAFDLKFGYDSIWFTNYKDMSGCWIDIVMPRYAPP